MSTFTLTTPTCPKLASLMCRTLADQRADCAPLDWLSSTLATPAARVRTAADYAPDLGCCPSHAGSLVYCLPRQPIAAGFEPVFRGGRLRLRLPAPGLRPALLIIGQRVGPVPEHEREGAVGTGELAYTVRRLTQMAADWLPDCPDPTRYLFELIAEAWRHAGTRCLGDLGIHRTSFESPIAAGTNRLELVTNRRRTGQELVNVYPIPADR